MHYFLDPSNGSTCVCRLEPQICLGECSRSHKHFRRRVPVATVPLNAHSSRTFSFQCTYTAKVWIFSALPCLTFRAKGSRHFFLITRPFSLEFHLGRETLANLIWESSLNCKLEEAYVRTIFCLMSYLVARAIGWTLHEYIQRSSCLDH